MEIKCAFDHYCFVILNLEESIKFYETALGLKQMRRAEASDGSAVRVYMGMEDAVFTIELTWFKANLKPYDLGDNKGHIAMRVSGNYDAVKAFHKENNWIVREIPEKNIHFVKDPDGNTVEVML